LRHLSEGTKKITAVYKQMLFSVGFKLTHAKDLTYADLFLTSITDETYFRI